MTRLPLLLLLAAACQPNFVAPPWLTRVEPNAVTDSAAADALRCGLTDGRQPVRRYADLTLWADPRTTLGGYNPGTGPNVVVCADLTANRKIWVHELIHGMLGVVGHPPIFARCGVAMGQI